MLKVRCQNCGLLIDESDAKCFTCGHAVNGAGPANSGQGGGGGPVNTGGTAGGKGVVIIRYSDAYNAASATTGSPTITSSGGYRIYQWTSSGSITF